MSGTTMKQARRQLERLVPAPWDLSTFIDRVAQHRSRPIHLVDVDFSIDGGISGAWKPTSRRDIVFVATSATGLRRLAVVCHEISHMWLDHTPENLGFEGEEGLETVIPALLEASPELARKFVRFRHNYGSGAEADAEYLATTVMSVITTNLPQGRARQVANSLLW